jgi:diketogulonate reductase-like aldo/keto reductase
VQPTHSYPSHFHRRAVQQLTAKHSATPEQVLFRSVAALGITPLTGSSSEENLRQDLAALQLDLSPAELQTVHELMH